MVPLWMLPMAIGCGNTFILKPSEQDPSAPAMFPEMLQKAGLPDGVFNLLHGSARAVNSLLTHPDIQAISFVGSTHIAEHIYRVGSESGKRVQTLGGAKNHAVVMPDADLGLPTEQLVGAAYGSAGERCMAISVVVAVGDDFGLFTGTGRSWCRFCLVLYGKALSGFGRAVQCCYHHGLSGESIPETGRHNSIVVSYFTGIFLHDLCGGRN